MGDRGKISHISNLLRAPLSCIQTKNTGNNASKKVINIYKSGKTIHKSAKISSPLWLRQKSQHMKAARGLNMLSNGKNIPNLQLFSRKFINDYSLSINYYLPFTTYPLSNSSLTIIDRPHHYHLPFVFTRIY